MNGSNNNGIAGITVGVGMNSLKLAK